MINYVSAKGLPNKIKQKVKKKVEDIKERNISKMKWEELKRLMILGAEIDERKSSIVKEMFVTILHISWVSP